MIGTTASSTTGPEDRARSGGETHVLLIGINDYAEPLLTSLTGCVNDIDDIQAVLIERLGVPAARITRLTAPAGSGGPVPARLPTRQNILDALESLAGAARAGDRVFIYYSGHGDFVELRGAAGVTLREVLVPSDVRIVQNGKPGRNVIYDVELIRMLRRIAERTPQVTVILDACHSAGATRGPLADGDTMRAACLGGSLTAEEWQAQIGEPHSDGDREIVRGLGGSLESCVVAAACLADEKAAEGTHADGRRGGYFSRALVGMLRQTAPSELAELRWGQIWRQIVAALEPHGQQHPQLLGSYARKVFGGPPEDGDTGFAVTRDGAEYRLGAGELAGVTPGAQVGVYGSTPLLLPAPGSQAEREARLGALEVTASRPGWARAKLAAGTTHEALAKGLRAQVTRPGHPSLAVAFDPPELLDAGLRQVLAASGFVRLADAGERAGAVIRRCENGEWALTDELHRTGDKPNEPCLIRVPPGTPPATIRALLEHYVVYAAPLEFARRCNDPPANLLRVSLLDCTNKSVDDAGFVDEPGFDPQSPQLPQLGANAAGQVVVRDGRTSFCIEVQNTGPRLLYVTLLQCGASGKVYWLGKETIPGRGRHVFWCDSSPGLPFMADLVGGRPVCFDRVVAIGTSVATADLKFLSSGVSFADIVRGRSTRDLTARTPIERWTSDQLVVRVERG